MAFGLLYRPPEWCVDIETPGRIWEGRTLHGFWAHLEWKDGGGADAGERARPRGPASDGAAGFMIYSRSERAECSNGSMESARFGRTPGEKRPVGEVQV